MSSTTEEIHYNFTLRVDMQSIQFSYVSAGEMTDDMAFNLAAAFKNLGWATGHDVAADVSKEDLTRVDYTADTTTPPTFT